MSKLIVLSNRVSLPQSEQHAGGLAVALNHALQDQGGIWLGWNGEHVKNPQTAQFTTQSHQQVLYITTPLSEAEYQGFYCGFANGTLWPMLHSRSDLIEEDVNEFDVYQQVNQRFAQHIATIAAPTDVIWIHDYHFLSIAKYCRQFGLKNRIGFFLHIPFASLHEWQQLKHAKRLLKDLLDYDLIGLQTEADQKNCLNTYQAMPFAAVDKNKVVHQHGQTLVNSYPIGVNPQAIQKAAQANTLKLEQYFEPCPNLTLPLVVSAERIDYSKGIPERLDAIEALLNEKSLQGQFAAVQIACPCRMEVPIYKRLYLHINQRIAAINHALHTQTWQPIYLSHQMMPHHELMQLYRKSAICWVDSLKDGMNLVAKEYIAAQDPHHPGVLVLSRYAGAAEQMQEALLVDPHDVDSLKQALYQALHMPLSERVHRYKALITGLYQEDIKHWRKCFLTDLNSIQSLTKTAV